MALASAASTGGAIFAITLRLDEPVFAMPAIDTPTAGALVAYVLVGGMIGLISTMVTRSVYWVEDGFEHYARKIHWMWMVSNRGGGGQGVGVFVPLTLGVGYSNITAMLNAKWGVGTGRADVCGGSWWGRSFGRGRLRWGREPRAGRWRRCLPSAARLEPLLGAGAHRRYPQCGHRYYVSRASLGMAAIFAGASRAMLASIVFAFETTLQPMGLLPLLGGCTTSYLVSCVLMRNTIMTEKIVRRGVRVPVEYASDFLDQVAVMEVASVEVVGAAG